MSSPAAASDVPAGYAELRGAVAWADLPGHATVALVGRDAVRFLDGFTTAAVAPLEVGGGAEGFVTDARGWVLALVTILRTGDGVWLDADPGLGGLLAAHLEHYHVREQLTIVDRSAEQACCVVAGPDAPAWLAARGVAPPGRFGDHGTAAIGPCGIHLFRTDRWGTPAFVLRAAAADAAALREACAAAGLPRASPAALETLRIEAGSPAAADIPEKTLPQELGRDARAISFTKGCYLGQETVARIDALGHVNRTFVGLHLDAARPPAPGASVHAGTAEVGVVTSACGSPRHGGALALALVQRRALAAGGLSIDGGVATVLARPAGTGS